VRITLATDTRSPVSLTRAHQRVLAELLASTVASVTWPSPYDDDPTPAPCIDGRPEYEPAPFHAWAWVPFAACWELEWSVPAFDVESGLVDAVDDVALSRIGWRCADAHERLDERALAWEGDFDDWNALAVVEEGGATRVLHPGFAVTIRAGSIEIDADEDDGGASLEFPAELELELVELACDLTGFRLAALEDPHGDVELSTAVRFEGACSGCWPEPDQPLPARESARRLAAALTDGGALVLARGASSAAVVAAAERALASPDAPSLARAARLAAELIACDEVEELFVDDESLAAWLEGW
jgi:hypothetical protein